MRLVTLHPLPHAEIASRLLRLLLGQRIRRPDNGLAGCISTLALECFRLLNRLHHALPDMRRFKTHHRNARQDEHHSHSHHRHEHSRSLPFRGWCG